MQSVLDTIGLDGKGLGGVEGKRKRRRKSDVGRGLKRAVMRREREEEEEGDE